MPLAVHAYALPQLFHTYASKLVLVRPDGHVAWRADALPGDCGTVLDVARGVHEF